MYIVLLGALIVDWIPKAVIPVFTTVMELQHSGVTEPSSESYSPTASSILCYKDEPFTVIEECVRCSSFERDALRTGEFVLENFAHCTLKFIAHCDDPKREAIKNGL